jgi:DNA-binding MarR family transcriptional regulator
MTNVPSETPGRHRRRVTTAIGDGLRDLRSELARLNHQVGMRVDLKDGDLEVLDLLDRHGPLSPGTLARRAGLHPATMTGILDRLERAGWITRDRDATDRRALVVGSTRHRLAEMLTLYSGMNARLNRICSGHSPDELEAIAKFLRQVTEAARQAADDLGKP